MTYRHGGRRRGKRLHECARASARVGAKQQQKKRAKRDHHQRGVTAGVAGVETSRPSGLAPAIIVGTYGNHSDHLLGQTTSSGPAASSEMVLHMLDTLMTGHEPFYADYPSYQETDPLTHPHHQHPHQHAIARNTGMPPVTLDATTHTPGTSSDLFHHWNQVFSVFASGVVRKACGRFGSLSYSPRFGAIFEEGGFCKLGHALIKIPINGAISRKWILLDSPLSDV